MSAQLCQEACASLANCSYFAFDMNWMSCNLRAVAAGYATNFVPDSATSVILIKVRGPNPLTDVGKPPGHNVGR